MKNFAFLLSKFCVFLATDKAKKQLKPEADGGKQRINTSKRLPLGGVDAFLSFCASSFVPSCRSLLTQARPG